MKSVSKRIQFDLAMGFPVREVVRSGDYRVASGNSIVTVHNGVIIQVKAISVLNCAIVIPLIGKLKFYFTEIKKKLGDGVGVSYDKKSCSLQIIAKNFEHFKTLRDLCVEFVKTHSLGHIIASNMDDVLIYKELAFNGSNSEYLKSELINPQLIESKLKVLFKLPLLALLIPLVIGVGLTVIFKEDAIKYSLPFPFFISILIYGFLVQDSFYKYKQTWYTAFVQSISFIILYISSWVVPLLIASFYGKIGSDLGSVIKLFGESFSNSKNFKMNISCGSFVAVFIFNSIKSVTSSQKVYQPSSLSEEDKAALLKSKARGFGWLVFALLLFCGLFGSLFYFYYK